MIPLLETQAKAFDLASSPVSQPDSFVDEINEEAYARDPEADIARDKAKGMAAHLFWQMMGCPDLEESDDVVDDLVFACRQVVECFEHSDDMLDAIRCCQTAVAAYDAKQSAA